MKPTRRVIAVVPCNNLDASEAFYRQLGFKQSEDNNKYRILLDGQGGEIHLNRAADGWLIPGQNPFGLYLFTEGVDELAAEMHRKAEDKPWGMYEFSLSDPDGALVRIGWPTRLKKTKP
jgi:catechol 2,3-dioxygenase-like lactoylglutathione lyase family enzyme